jgi:hypothetical protein
VIYVEAVPGEEEAVRLPKHHSTDGRELSLTLLTIGILKDCDQQPGSLQETAKMTSSQSIVLITGS